MAVHPTVKVVYIRTVKRSRQTVNPHLRPRCVDCTSTYRTVSRLPVSELPRRFTIPVSAGARDYETSSKLDCILRMFYSKKALFFVVAISRTSASCSC